MILYNYETEFLLTDETKLTKWIESTILGEEKTLGEISYIFCDDDYILNINQQYLQHDYYTDIITFDYTEGNTISGDVFISLDTVSSNAKKFDVDFDEELKRVMIHGVLHLIGYKDKSEEEAKQMREKENYYLEKFKSLE